MSKYLLAVDPVLLLEKKEFVKIASDKKNMKDMGSLGDVVKDRLQDKYEFADVFQSTSETHDIRVHDFLMADKTNKRGLHSAGSLETPTGLVAYVTVDDEWMSKNSKIADKAAIVKLDPRVNPSMLHANDGATKDGDTTGFVRYGDYNTPVMTMVPANKELTNESVEDMERRADEREHELRNRKPSKLKSLVSTMQRVKQATGMDAFIAGWNMVDEWEHWDDNSNVKLPNTPQADAPATTIADTRLTSALRELSIQEMERNDGIGNDDMFRR